MIRILIVEHEYLIAMDAERILTEAMECTVAITTAKKLSKVLETQYFDIALIDVGAFCGPSMDDMAKILATNCKLAFTTVDEILGKGVRGFENYPVLLKPYHDLQLITLVRLLAGSNAR